MKITMKGNNFTDVGNVFDLPSDWDGEIEAEVNNFLRVGNVVKVRDVETEIPTELTVEIVEAYKDAVKSGLTADKATEKISSLPNVQHFLLEKGVDILNLGVVTAQLLLQIFGRQ